MNEDNDFEIWYKKILVNFNEQLVQLEETIKNENKKTSIKLKISIWIILIVTILIIFLENIFNIMDMASVIAGVIVVDVLAISIIVGVLLTNDKESTKKRIEIKRSINNIMFEAFDNHIEYKREKGIEPEIYKKVGVKDCKYYYSNNLMSFKINNNYSLEMAEVQTHQIHKDGKGEKDIETTFYGTFATIDTPKTFNEQVYIKKDMHENKDPYSELLPYKKMRIELDSQDFEEKFDVYASNEILGMQLVTSDIMLMLDEFYKYIQKEFEITIKDNTICIRIWNQSTFNNSLLTGRKRIR